MVTVLSDIPTAHGGTSHVTIHDLPIPGNIVWYAADVALPSGQHREWRFGYTRLHARKETEEGRVVTPETFTPFVREVVAQRLQHERVRDYPDLVFGVRRPLPPRAFGQLDTSSRDYTDPSFDIPLPQAINEEYYGMLAGYGSDWTMEDFRRFRDEVAHEGDEENGKVMSIDG